jgi:hypothetical protein
VPITIRPGVMSDLPFMDHLQKLHAKQVGWMPTKQFEGKIKLGHVIIAEDEQRTPVGYCIGNDQYFKRDDAGIIYQMNVVPERQRGLIGATLVKAMFERAAYGCRLFCCWCAQDIEANHFWESLGFVPLAFRAGSRTKGSGGTPRVHIFWQRRIRAGDTTTPYWFPSQTTSGSIREDRIVLPIPPGTHWRDAKPIVLPGGERDQRPEVRGQQKRISGPRSKRLTSDLRPLTAAISSGGLRFAGAEAPVEKTKKRAGKMPATPRQKNDPKLIAAARELRDRWLEKVNDDPSILSANGKYDVTRQLAISDRQSEIGDRQSLPAPLAA